MERCEKCGFVWDLVPHAEVPSRLVETAADLSRLLFPPDRPSDWASRLATRPSAEVWSAIEYACHIRDVLFVQRDRVFVLLVEDSPTFGPMYREERVTLGRYADEDLADVVHQIETAARLLARTLAVLDKAAFERTAVYSFPTVQTRTLSWVGAQCLHEMLHHFDDIAAQVAPHASGIDAVRASPSEIGRLELVVRRPAVGERETLAEGVLDINEGLVGDSWRLRPSTRTPDRSPHPEMQLNLMNSRAAALLCGDKDLWPLAGDQLFVDFDLSVSALVPGTRLRIGVAVIEVTAQPHRGCGKFADRFGRDALRLVNSTDGRALNLRGINAKVVTGGVIRPGDPIERLPTNLYG